MYTLIVIIILIIAAIGLKALYSVFRVKINFFITGLDSGFAIPDLLLLWKVATICELEQPTDLFFSMSALTKCMGIITNQSSSEGDANSHRNQKILTKLFDYRTKLQNKNDDKKGVESSQSIEKGQPLRIIFPGKGVFSSTVLNNGTTLAISMPRQKNLIPIPAEEWVGRVISIYFWRKGDARYVFDSTVMQNGLFLGKTALFLKHSSNLLRTQKRKSVRVECTILGTLFIVQNNSVDTTAVETRNGYKCLILDVSESGALIKIGGKGAENIKIKLQFQINNKLILMFGVIRTVEYDMEKNQSLLHFECTNIEQTMRNEILSFVYNTMPSEEKEIFEALEQTDLDEKAMKAKEATGDANKTAMASDLEKVDAANENRINKIDNPNLLDKDIKLTEDMVPSAPMPEVGIATEDFSADDIEELEEV